MTTKVNTKNLAFDEVSALRFLLHPFEYRIQAKEEDADVIICRSPYHECSKPLIKIPRNHCQLTTSLEPTCDGNEIVDLQFDVLGVCSNAVADVMNPRISIAYRILSSLPFEYRIVPGPMRNPFLKARRSDWDLSRHLSCEIARKVLVEAFDRVGLKLKKRAFPSLLVTHDIETQKGLSKALLLKSVEDDLNITSTWFLLSDEYEIPKAFAREFSDRSTIGSHDTRHDGKLVTSRNLDALASRLKESKSKLERIFEREVRSFRSPLLQFNRNIATGLEAAGYDYDFSLPCWEPAHPVTMRGFGIESAHPFYIGGVTELPLTLFQDYQVLHVLQMNLRQAVRFLLHQAELIRFFDGEVVLLIHPEYSFSSDLGVYRNLLVSLLQGRSERENDFMGKTDVCMSRNVTGCDRIE